MGFVFDDDRKVGHRAIDNVPSADERTSNAIRK
jgi:hypothetical protein